MPRCRRLTYLSITVIAAVFLVTLGMRISFLGSEFQKPKPRPRAIIEDVEKLKEEITRKCQTDESYPAAVPVMVAFAFPCAQPAQFHVHNPLKKVTHPLATLPSRAPPAVSTV